MTFDDIPRIEPDQPIPNQIPETLPTDSDAEFVITDNSGPILSIHREGFNGLRFEFHQPKLVMTPFDTHRVLEAIRAVLASLPLDMYRPGPD